MFENPTWGALKPLPVRLVPKEWQDLPSFIIETAAHLNYSSPGWILSPENANHTIYRTGLLTLYKPLDYQLLSTLLNLSMAQIHQLTVHRFTPVLQAYNKRTYLTDNTPDESNKPFEELSKELILLDNGVQSKFFNARRATKLCPACLEEDGATSSPDSTPKTNLLEGGYGRLYWHFMPVVACLRHHQLLIEHCPSCHAPIPALRHRFNNCPRCNIGDYRQIIGPTPHLNNPFFWGGQLLILSRLGVEKKNSLEAHLPVELIQSPLLGLPPQQYFRLLNAFRFLVVPFLPYHPLLIGGSELADWLTPTPTVQSNLTPSQWAVIVATFHYTFADWPTNFQDFLETFYQFKNKTTPGINPAIGHVRSLSVEFGQIYKTWMSSWLKDPEFFFLREAFAEFLGQNYRRGHLNGRQKIFLGEQRTELLQKRTYLGFKQAYTRLDISKNLLQKLIVEGVLPAYQGLAGPAGQKKTSLIEKSAVENLYQELKGFLLVEKVGSQILGVTSHRVLSLAEGSVLNPARGPQLDGYNHWLYREDEVNNFVKSLLQMAKPASIISEAENKANGKLVSLSNITRRYGRELKLTDLLAASLAGKLILIDSQNDKPLFQRLMVAQPDLWQFAEDYERIQQERPELLTTYEVAARLNMPRMRVYGLAKQGYLNYAIAFIKGKKILYLFEPEQLVIKSLDKTERK